MSQSELELAEFADNPEPRCAVVLLLDTSGSMHGQPISELNAGLKEFENALKSDRLASLRVEVAVVTFGGSVKVLGSGSEGSHETTLASIALGVAEEHPPLQHGSSSGGS